MKEHFLDPTGAAPPRPVQVRDANSRAFETAVCELIRQRSVAGQPSAQRPQVSLTRRSGDQGRDIVVEGLQTDRFLGLALPPSAGPRTIYVECKLTTRGRLTLDHVAANVLQLAPSAGSVFLLITNGTMTPRAMATVLRQCERIGLTFLIVDAWTIGQRLPELIAPVAAPEATPTLLASYQVLRDPIRADKYAAHFVFRSSAEQPVKVSIGLHSTRDWIARTDDAGAFAVDQGGLAVWSADLTPSGPGQARAFTVSLTIDGKRTLHQIIALATEEIATLPLFESDMTRKLSHLRSQLNDGSLPRLSHIHGVEGTGKSRLLAELREDILAQGLPCQSIVLHDDDLASITTYAAGTLERTNVSHMQLAALLEARLRPDALSTILLVDDVHAAPASVLDALLSLAFGAQEGVAIVSAGRSDPVFRRPAYEVFAAQVREHANKGDLAHGVLGAMAGSDLQAALRSLLGEDAFGGLSAGEGHTHLRPIDLVHAIHSLMEHSQVYWSDEEHLSLSVRSDEGADHLLGSILSNEVLETRYQRLAEFEIAGFRLAGLMEVLAVLADPARAYQAIAQLLSDGLISIEVVALWLELDEAGGWARFRHGSLKDFLERKFYSFRSQPGCSEILGFTALDRTTLDRETQAAFALSDGDLADATRLIAAFAQKLGRVTNISSLELAESDYNAFATLLTILEQSPRRRRILLHRCVVARAYLNAHHRAFALGFIDNLGLIGFVETLPDTLGGRLMSAAVKQLMAHALANGGDTRSALFLMHEVENLLDGEKSRVAKTIEFDMCDRLQAHYSQQAAFLQARRFFFRARRCADHAKDPALLNLSFSAEFHLTRYLDVDGGLQLAQRQLAHARGAAPERTLFHARVNALVAAWTKRGGALTTEEEAEIGELLAASRNAGYGHLIPRLEYLLAAHEFQEWQEGLVPMASLDARLSEGSAAARRYGYEDYVWLVDTIELLKLIESDADAAAIVQRASRLVDHLQRLGLNFVAGDELCFQNTVVLSNALRALHEYSDQQTAWAFANKIAFSPMFVSSAADKRRRLERVFHGELMSRIHDPRAVMLSRRGYAIALV